MHLNLQQLGVNEKLMEENGISITPNSTASQIYFDTSTNPPAAGRFDHTYDGPNKHQHVPVDSPALERGPGIGQGTPESSVRTLDSHPLLLQSQEAVYQLDRSLGRTSDTASACMSASLACLARENGMTRVDHVLLSQQTDTTRQGENVFVVQGRLDDPAHLVAHMKTNAAVETPVKESLQRLDQLDQTMAQRAQLAVQTQQDLGESQRRSMTM